MISLPWIFFFFQGEIFGMLSLIFESENMSLSKVSFGILVSNNGHHLLSVYYLPSTVLYILYAQLCAQCPISTLWALYLSAGVFLWIGWVSSHIIRNGHLENTLDISSILFNHKTNQNRYFNVQIIWYLHWLDIYTSFIGRVNNWLQMQGNLQLFMIFLFPSESH